MSGFYIDEERGRKIGVLLYNLFSTTGIHGKTEMPEDILPEGMEHGSLDHLMFITLTVALDYQRDANALWEAARNTYEDTAIRYLFRPDEFYERTQSQVIEDMQRYGLSKKQKRDAGIWRTVILSFLKKWDGDPRNFLEDCSWNAHKILWRLKEDAHEFNGQKVNDYPNLRGKKIGPLWLRMLRDNVKETRLEGMEKVPIPVDVHVARATFSLGIVNGIYDGALEGAFEKIREAWTKSTKGYRLHNRDMIALDIDEPLWHLSKYGCTRRDQNTGICPLLPSCVMRDYCVSGVVIVNSKSVKLDT